MSLEKFAREKLMRDLPGFRKNGLRHWIKVIDKEHWLEGMVEENNHGFVPDGTRLRRQPPHNPDYQVLTPLDAYDVTLELWEIEDTSKIGEVKMENIRRMAHELFDMSAVFTELWVTNRYGNQREKVWDIRDEIDGGGKMDFHEPCEWMTDDEWVTDSEASNQLVNAP
jgi:hypothetical protein